VGPHKALVVDNGRPEEVEERRSVKDEGLLLLCRCKVRFVDPLKYYYLQGEQLGDEDGFHHEFFHEYHELHAPHHLCFQK